MKILGNFLKDFISTQKEILYRYYILPNIMLFYKTAVLKKMEISRAQNFLLYLVQSTEFPFSFSLEDRIFGLEDRIFGLEDRITISY